SEVLAAQHPRRPPPLVAWERLAHAWASTAAEPSPGAWAEAIAAQDAAGMAVEASRSRIRRAEALLALGARDGAAAELTAARPPFVANGARPLLAELDALARRAGLRLDGRAPLDGPTALGLTPREV